MAGTFAVGALFAVLPFLSGSTLATRWLMFSLWAVAVGAALSLTGDSVPAVLAGPLACDPNDMVWVEPMRQFIDEALTQTTGPVSLPVPAALPSLTVQLGKPWPGVVDDTGVQVYIAMSGKGTTVATLTGPDGTSWIIPVSAATGWYFTRSVFTGKPAGGTWTLNSRRRRPTQQRPVTRSAGRPRNRARRSPRGTAPAPTSATHSAAACRQRSRRTGHDRRSGGGADLG